MIITIVILKTNKIRAFLIVYIFGVIFIQTKHFRVSKDHLTNKLNFQVTKLAERSLTFDESSFLDIISSSYNLKPFQKDSLRWVYIQSKQYKLLTRFLYENTIMACLLFVLKYRSNSLVYENVSIQDYVELIWKKEDQEKMTIQIYSAFQNLEAVFYEPEPYITDAEEQMLIKPIWKA